MENKLDFSTKMKLAAVKPLLPMLRPSAQKFFDTLLADTRTRLQIEQGEVQAALVCFSAGNGEILFCAAALDADNRIVRIVEQRTLDDLMKTITSIL